MEKLYFEILDISRKKDAIEYISEFYRYHSDINGSGGLDRYLDHYEGWLENWKGITRRSPMRKGSLPELSSWFGKLTGGSSG